MKQQIEEFASDLLLNGRQASTVKKHREELVRLQRWLEGEKLEWQTLTRRNLQRYTRLRADRGHSCRANMMCTLRTFYRWAVEQEYAALSPAAAFKTPIRPRPQPRALSMEQVRILVRHLQQQEGRRARRDEVLLLTALYTGLRAKELAQLAWSDIDTTVWIINIEISKMNHGRSVSVHPDLQPVLQGWRELQGMGQDGPVFSLNGVSIRPNRVGKIATKVRKATGLPLTAHVLRHTFATWALRRSRDLYSVSKALGHRQLAQTEIYVSTDVETIRPAINMLPGIASW